MGLDQVYITNLEKMQADVADQSYQISRIGDWMDALVMELRYANAMKRAAMSSIDDEILTEQGY